MNKLSPKEKKKLNTIITGILITPLYIVIAALIIYALNQ